MKQALEDRATHADDLIASGHQVEMLFKRGEKTLTLRAQKLWHLLVKKAGPELGEDKLHSIPLADLREIGHMPIEARIDALRELQRTLVEVSAKLEDGKLYMRSGALLSTVDQAIEDAGLLRWKFSDALRLVFANSDHWAILSKRAVMAFESRYSLRLYEIVGLRSGLDHKTSEIFGLENLRDRLGVPVGKLERWQDVKVKALEPAIAEVNQLAGFNVGYEPIKKGRSVAAVKLTWGEKSAPERKAAKRELDGHRAGRKARRMSQGEILALPASRAAPAPSRGFPRDGGISFGKWAELARANLPRPTPDIEMVASAFRKWAHEKNLPFDAQGVEKAFVGFCKNFRIK